VSDKHNGHICEYVKDTFYRKLYNIRFLTDLLLEIYRILRIEFYEIYIVLLLYSIKKSQKYFNKIS